MTFPVATAKKERLKTRTTISIGSWSALDFRCLVALGAAMADNERTEGSDAKLNNQLTKENTSEKNTETEADYLSTTAGV